MPVTILFTGDLGLTEKCEQSQYLFDEELQTCFSTVDATCLNLELPFTDAACKNAPYTHPSLCSSDQLSYLLKKLNPSIVNTGTNHCMDGCKRGLILTKQLINDMGALAIGTGINEAEARRPAFLKAGDKTFGFLSYCKKGSFTAGPSKPGAALLSSANLETDIPKAKSNCDFLIVSMHMGMEFSKSVHPMYRELAHLAVDLGASCIVGHHPHVIQGIEDYKGAPIFYSLGNFLFDNYAGAVTYKAHWKERHQGILAKVSFSESGVSWETIPTVYTSRPLAVRLAKGEEREEILQEIEQLSEAIALGCNESEAETEAFSAIAKREIATILVLTRIHGFRFITYFLKDLKIRHFKMVFRGLLRKIRGAR